MTETVPERLIHSLRTEAPYKHALEIMADDLTQWLRDEGVHDGDIFEHSIILGQGDYPTGRQIIENAIHKMNEAATALEAAQARIAELEGIRIRILNQKLSGEWRDEVAAVARREALEEADRAVNAVLVRNPRHDEARRHAKAAIGALMENPMQTDEIEKLLEEAKQRYSEITPEEWQAMLRAQRESYVIAEMGFGSDKDEAEYRDAILSGDADRIAACEAAAQERMAVARAALEGRE